MELRKFVLPESILGEEALGLAGRYASNLCARKVLVVTDPGVAQAGWLQLVLDSLKKAGVTYVVFDQVAPNPTDNMVMAGAGLYLQEQCNMIIAVGGGSPMDCAKGIGIAATNGQHVLAFQGVDKVKIPGPPLICIPTTAGTSADVSQFAIITDSQQKVKIAIISKAVVPDVALIDPLTTVTMPAELTAAVGMDALVHAIEAYVSRASSPLTDLHALEAVRLIVAHLPGAIEEPKNLAHRNPMMLASMLAGLAFSNASLGLVHAMAHSLGGFLDLPHGQCNALLLEHVVAFNYPHAAGRYAKVAAAFGLAGAGKSDGREELTAALSAFRQRAGIRFRLRELGVAQADLALLAEKALQDPCVVTNPVMPTREEIQAIYELAF